MDLRSLPFFLKVAAWLVAVFTTLALIRCMEFQSSSQLYIVFNENWRYIATIWAIIVGLYYGLKLLTLAFRKVP